jgi:hypothetical protein
VVAGEPPAQCPQSIVVTPQQRVEGVAVTGLGRLDERSVVDVSCDAGTVDQPLERPAADDVPAVRGRGAAR